MAAPRGPGGTAPQAVVPEDVMDPDVADALRAAYEVPPRRYHTFAHAGTVAGLVRDLGGDRACLLAAWAHDVVYDPQGEGNEAASAAWLREHLAGDPDVEEAARLVEVTATHDPDPGDVRAEVLCDADLAVLGGSPEDYEAYRQAVREEYAHVDDAGWRVGREAVLYRLLERPTIYRTDVARDRWEAAAQDNLAAEVAALT